jgi:hypothetical protein
LEPTTTTSKKKKKKKKKKKATSIRQPAPAPTPPGVIVGLAAVLDDPSEHFFEPRLERFTALAELGAGPAHNGVDRVQQVRARARAKLACAPLHAMHNKLVFAHGVHGKARDVFERTLVHGMRGRVRKVPQHLVQLPFPVPRHCEREKGKKEKKKKKKKKKKKLLTGFWRRESALHRF